MRPSRRKARPDRPRGLRAQGAERSAEAKVLAAQRPKAKKFWRPLRVEKGRSTLNGRGSDERSEFLWSVPARLFVVDARTCTGPASPMG